MRIITRDIIPKLILAAIFLTILSPVIAAQLGPGVNNPPGYGYLIPGTNCQLNNLYPYQATPIQGSICTFCQTYDTITLIIEFIALGFLALGGLLYAAAHLLPGQRRGGMQSYSYGLIIGGIVGIIFVILAPFIITTITSSTINPLITSVQWRPGFDSCGTAGVPDTGCGGTGYDHTQYDTLAHFCWGAGIL